MKAIVQRASHGQVTVDKKIVGKIGNGFVVLLGVTHEDDERDIEAIVQKLIHLRIFEDEDGKMNRSLLDVNGSILSISQFTLYGDIRKGRRPSFVKAAAPEFANKLYESFNQSLRDEGVHVETGVFGAMMQVELNNDGPVTIIIESKDGKII